MPETLAPWNWRVPLADGSDFFKTGFTALRNLATDIGASLTAETDKARAQLYQSTAQTNIPAGWAAITMQSETHDTHNGHATNAAGYTVPAGHGGDWLVSGSVQVTAVTGLLAVRLAVNGAVVPNVGHGDYESSTGGQERSIPGRILTLAAGNVVTLEAQVTGAAWSTSVALAAGATSVLTLVEL